MAVTAKCLSGSRAVVFVMKQDPLLQASTLSRFTGKKTKMAGSDLKRWSIDVSVQRCCLPTSQQKHRGPTCMDAPSHDRESRQLDQFGTRQSILEVLGVFHSIPSKGYIIDTTCSLFIHRMYLFYLFIYYLWDTTCMPVCFGLSI